MQGSLELSIKVYDRSLSLPEKILKRLCWPNILLRRDCFRAEENVCRYLNIISWEISGLERDTIKVPQINGVSFKYPSSPILSEPEDTMKKLTCTLDEHSSECADTPLYCECLQLIQVPSRKTVEIVLIDEGNYPVWRLRRFFYIGLFWNRLT